MAWQSGIRGEAEIVSLGRRQRSGANCPTTWYWSWLTLVSYLELGKCGPDLDDRRGGQYTPLRLQRGRLIDMEFNQPWIAIGKFAEKLVTELKREVTPSHILWDIAIQPVAQRLDCDDVLFELLNHPKHYAVVHLTWSGKAESGDTPECILFDTFDDWLREGMVERP